MKSLRDNISTGFIILILVNLVTSYDCPEDCSCSSPVIDGGITLNHVKCHSLNGLKGEEKILSIHSLDLSQANIDRISHSLEKLKDLTNLDLSHNDLSDVGRLGKRIKTLNLNNNKITSGKLPKIPRHVQTLDLSFNEITYLPLEITKLKSLKKIELTGNAINCTCETLEVRNWLQENHVWTDNIKCTYPAEIKGQPWLRIKQSEICAKNDTNEKLTTKYNESENENDLMLGDQAIINEGSGDSDLDELGQQFLVVSKNNDKKFERMVIADQEEDNGSGDDEVTHQKYSSVDDLHPNEPDQEADEDYDGSGSGGGPIVIPLSVLSDDVSDDLIIPTISTTTERYSSNEDFFGPGLGIIEFNAETNTTELAVTDDLIVPVVHVQDSAVPTFTTVTEKVLDKAVEIVEEEEGIPSSTDDNVDVQNASIKLEEENGATLKEAGASDNSNAYILLAVVLALLVALILFVAVKRTRAKRRIGRQADPESPRATELQDMDKKNLGKPIHKNGTAEHAPLIEDRNKTNIAKSINGSKKIPYANHEDKDGKVQEPLLKDKEEPDSKNYEKIPNSQSESNNNVPTVQKERPHHETPVCNNQDVPTPAVRKSLENSTPESRKDVYPPPKSPRTKKPSTGDDEVFHPSSPKATSRYSPVYSPETGRVKIKLTETPKPKTPLLVTRSRSNAGDIITTPNENQTLPANQ